MTVKELIDKLMSYPDNAVIVTLSDFKEGKKTTVSIYEHDYQYIIMEINCNE